MLVLPHLRRPHECAGFTSLLCWPRRRSSRATLVGPVAVVGCRGSSHGQYATGVVVRRPGSVLRSQCVYGVVRDTSLGTRKAVSDVGVGTADAFTCPHACSVGKTCGSRLRGKHKAAPALAMHIQKSRMILTKCAVCANLPFGQEMRVPQHVYSVPSARCSSGKRAATTRSANI